MLTKYYYHLHPLVESKRWRAPKLLDKLKFEFEVKTLEEQGVGAHSLVRNTLGVEGCAGAPGIRKNDKHLITHTNLHKPNNKLVSA
jgi:hypothetical protein